MIKNTLLLFTNTFPYGSGESFLETEIIYLAQEFDKILIYPIDKTGNKRTIPSNIEIGLDFCAIRPNSFSPRKIILDNIPLIFTVLWYELIKSKKRKLFYGKFEYYFNTLIYRIANSDILLKELEKSDSETTVYYSYWFNQWSSLLCLVTGKLKIKIQQRIHGYDYDPLRHENGFIPFRTFEMTRISRLFPASNYGVYVIKRDYPSFKSIHPSQLGVLSRGLNPINNSDILKIVSCSNLISLKRVHLIIDILSYLEVKTEWTHFGDGEAKNEIEERIKLLAETISVKLMGQKQNVDVLNFYEKNPVDLFISVSEIEGGVPVSIMEAISFGIPCIGCDIGGVNEIVNSRTGFLVEKEFSPKHVALLIQKFFLSDVETKLKLGKSARVFWEENYDAEKNYKRFVNEISS